MSVTRVARADHADDVTKGLTGANQPWLTEYVMIVEAPLLS